MKCLTIKSYWLEKILSGEKTLEVRSFNPKYRGLIVLCSSKANGVSGRAVATAELTEVFTMQGEQDVFLSQACVSLKEVSYKKPHFWKLENVKLIHPVEVKGQLGLFERDILISYKQKLQS